MTDGECDGTRGNTLLMVLARNLTGELEKLGSEVLQHSGEVHRGGGGHTLGVASTAEHGADAAHGKDQTRLRATALLAALDALRLLAALRGSHSDRNKREK